MGHLLYGHSAQQAYFDDRTLVHIHIVISSKLRRHESFFLSWQDEVSAGGGRSSVWVDRAVPLCFRFSGGIAGPINHRWLEILTASANSPRGLHVVPEPMEAAPLQDGS